MSEDPKKTAPMYAETDNVQLVIGSETIKGHKNVTDRINKLGTFAPSGEIRFISQPYGSHGDVLIMTKLQAGGNEYITSFLLREVDKSSHQFGIIAQLLHPVTK